MELAQLAAMDEQKLIGSWVSDPDDVESKQVHGWARLRFSNDGTVVTTTHPEGGPQTRTERFRTEGDELYIREGASEKCIAFRFTEDDRLILGLGEGESRYRRE